MPRLVRMMLLVLAMSSFQGCNPAYVPLKTALKAVGQDLVDTKVTNISDLLGTAEEAKAFKQQIQGFQCFNEKANPLIPLFAKDFSLSLQGTFTLGGNISGGASGSVPSGTIGFNVSDVKTQGLTVPITWTPLDSLPKAYLQQQMSYITDGNSAAFKTYYSKVAEDTYMKLTGQIKLIMDEWTTAKPDCSKISSEERDYPGGSSPKILAR